MPAERTGHDDRLLDALTSLPETSFSGTIWRVVNSIRSSIDGSRGSGRWNTRKTQVLYCSLEADGALTEIHFQISRANPIFPSRLRHTLFQFDATLKKVLDLTEKNQLSDLGVDMSRYSEILYSKTQEVGEAVSFLGFEGLIVPNARHESVNLVIFMENFNLDRLDVVEDSSVDWKSWRERK